MGEALQTEEPRSSERRSSVPPAPEPSRTRAKAAMLPALTAISDTPSSPGTAPVPGVSEGKTDSIPPPLPRPSSIPPPLPTRASTPSISEISLAPGAGRRFDPSTLRTVSTFGRFEVLGRIAFGGMAEILLVRDPDAGGANASNTPKHLVVKRMLPNVAAEDELRAMFEDEARIAMRLDHPGICRVLEFGAVENTPFITMDWVDGVPLSRLARHARDGVGRFPARHAARIIAKVAAALQYAHVARDEQGKSLEIVHRDVTPQNVMVAFDGSVKLLDFGVARSAWQHAHTAAGIVKGKLNYMAPEQCRAESIDGRADVFSLGVCLWEILAGRTLFKRATEFETLRAVVEDEAPSIRTLRPDVDPSLASIIARAITKDPAKRYQSAGALAEALDLYMRETGERVRRADLAALVCQLFADDVTTGPKLAAITGTMPIDGTPTNPERPAAGRAIPGRALPSGTESLDLVSSDSLPRPSSTLTPVALPARIVDAAARARDRRKYVAVAGWMLATGLFGFAVYGVSRFLASRTDRDLAVASTEMTSNRVRSDQVTTAVRSGVAPRSEDVDTSGEKQRLIEAARARTIPRPAAAAVDTEPVDPEAGDVTRAEPPPAAPTSVAVAPAPEAVPRLVVPATPRLPVARHAPTPRGHTRGRLSINTRPWSHVYVGSRDLGVTPLGEVRVSAGTLSLRLVDANGVEHRRTVEVRPNETTVSSFDLSRD